MDLSGKITDCDNTAMYSFEIESRYVADNCAVVAVLINTETKEVVQAAQVALGNASH